MTAHDIIGAVLALPFAIIWMAMIAFMCRDFYDHWRNP